MTCGECGGDGYLIEVEPECCGKYWPCRDDCAAPVQVQRQCERCGGAGEVGEPT
jgi:hypothetical protein